MSNSEAICHCALKWDLQSGQQNPQYSQKKKTKTHTHTHTQKKATNSSGKRSNESAF